MTKITQKFTVHIENGKMKLENIRKFKKFIEGKTDGQYFLTVKKKIKNRSSLQNRYYFGVIVRMICDEVGDKVDDIETGDVHNHLKNLFLKKTNGIVPIIRSTSDLTTIEFEEYLTKCRQWASIELNMYIPLPNEVDIPDYY